MIKNFIILGLCLVLVCSLFFNFQQMRAIKEYRKGIELIVSDVERYKEKAVKQQLLIVEKVKEILQRDLETMRLLQFNYDQLAKICLPRKKKGKK